MLVLIQLVYLSIRSQKITLWEYTHLSTISTNFFLSLSLSLSRAIFCACQAFLSNSRWYFIEPSFVKWMLSNKLREKIFESMHHFFSSFFDSINRGLRWSLEKKASASKKNEEHKRSLEISEKKRNRRNWQRIGESEKVRKENEKRNWSKKEEKIEK